MPVEVTVPSFGESISEGVLARWLKADGDLIRRDEPVAEMESEKATSEVRATASGRLKTTVKEGQTVPVGAVIATIDESVAVPEPLVGLAAAAEPAKPTSGSGASLSPAARVLAQSRGVETAQLTGSGRGGRIIKEDVVAKAPPTSNGEHAPIAPAV